LILGRGAALHHDVLLPWLLRELNSSLGAGGGGAAGGSTRAGMDGMGNSSGINAAARTIHLATDPARLIHRMQTI